MFTLVELVFFLLSKPPNCFIYFLQSSSLFAFHGRPTAHAVVLRLVDQTGARKLVVTIFLDNNVNRWFRRPLLAIWPQTVTSSAWHFTPCYLPEYRGTNAPRLSLTITLPCTKHRTLLTLRSCQMRPTPSHTTEKRRSCVSRGRELMNRVRGQCCQWFLLFTYIGLEIRQLYASFIRS